MQQRQELLVKLAVAGQDAGLPRGCIAEPSYTETRLPERSVHKFGPAITRLVARTRGLSLKGGKSRSNSMRRVRSGLLF